MYLTVLRSLLEAARNEGPEIGRNTGGFFTTTQLPNCGLFPEIES
jgi:hypothetical protein